MRKATSLIIIPICTFLLGSMSDRAAAEPAIYLPEGAHKLQEDAAHELQRYLYLVTGEVLPVSHVANPPSDPEGFALFTLDQLDALKIEWPGRLERPEGEGYSFFAPDGALIYTVIAASNPLGVQHGVYAFLEKLGFGFYLSGDTYPEPGRTLQELHPEGLEDTNQPAFSVRGLMPLQMDSPGAERWTFDDYRHYIDQLARMRLNTVLFKAESSLLTEESATAGTPGAIRSVPGGHPGEASRSPAELVPSDSYLAGTGKFFPHNAMQQHESQEQSPEAAAEASRKLLERAIAYARSRGLHAGIALEAGGEPLTAEGQEQLDSKLRAALEAFPHMDQLWLWQPRHQAAAFRPIPLFRSRLAGYLRRWEQPLDGIQHPEYRAETARFSLNALQVRQTLDAIRPDIELTLCNYIVPEKSWRFQGIPALDALLPASMALSARHEPALPFLFPEDTNALHTGRSMRPLIYLESGDSYPEPHMETKRLAEVLETSGNAGGDGWIGAHWRIRPVENATAFAARYSWDTELTPERHFARRAKDLYGSALQDRLAPLIERFDQLDVGRKPAQSRVSARNSAHLTRDSQRTDLLQIANSLRVILSEEGLLEGIQDVVGGVLRETRLDTFIPREGRKAIGIEQDVLPGHRTALRDLLNRIEYRLYIEHASSTLLLESRLAQFADQQDDQAIVEAIRQSKLPDAFQAFARQIRTKSELSVLHALNQRIWGKVLDEVPLSEDTVKQLADAGVTTSPQILVLPDQALVLGLDKPPAQLVLKARPIGGDSFETFPLDPINDFTYALQFPEAVEAWRNVEYQVEIPAPGMFSRITGGGRGVQSPLMTRTQFPGDAPPLPAGPEPPQVAVPLPDTSVDRSNQTVEIRWEPQPGFRYRVSRDNKPLGYAFDGWFEDFAPPSGSVPQYTIEAAYMNGPEATHTDRKYWRMPLPEFPVPGAPKEIEIQSRGNRVILGWLGEDPLADKYLITKSDLDLDTLQQDIVPGAYGHYHMHDDEAGRYYSVSYSIAGISPDGRSGPGSKKMGILVVEPPLDPVIRLGIQAGNPLGEALPGDLALLAKEHISMGGVAHFENPKQPAWNPSENLTLSVWVRFSDTSRPQVVVCKGAWAQPAYFLELFDGVLRFYMAGLGTLHAGRPEPGVWHHVAAVYGHQEMRLYLDGDLAGRRAVEPAAGALSEASLPPLHFLAEGEHTLDGKLDDLLVYNAELSPGEVASLAQDKPAE